MTARPTISVGHTMPISSACLSPDGKKLFTMDGANIRVWDTATRKEIKLLKSYGGGTSGDTTWRIAFAEDRKWMLIPHWSHLSVFNYETLEEVSAWPQLDALAVGWDAKRGKGYYAALYVDGDRRLAIGELLVAGGKFERTVRTVVVLQPPPKRMPDVRRIDVLEGDRLFLDTNCGYVAIDLKTWTAFRPDVEPTREQTTVASAPGRTVPLARFPALPMEMAYAPGPDGTIVGVTGVYSRDGQQIEVRSASDFSVLRTNGLATRTLFFDGAENYDPKSGLLWLRSFEHLYAVDLQTLALHKTVDLAAAVKGADTWGAFSHASRLPEPNRFLLTDKRKTWIHDVAIGKVVSTFGERSAVIRRIITNPTAFEFLITNRLNRAKRVRFSPAGLHVTSVSGAIDALAYDPSGETIARGSSAYGKAELSDTATWPKVEYRLPQSGSTEHGSAANFAYSADGAALALHHSSGVAVISTENGQTLLAEKLSRKAIPDVPHLVAISPDRRWVVAYDGEKKIVGFDLTAPKGKQRVWEQHTGTDYLFFQFVGPDRFLCSAGATIEYRSADSGVQLREHALEGIVSDVQAIAVSHDHTRVAICSSHLLIYEAESGKHLWEHPLETNVTSAAFLSDPRFLLTVSGDNLIRLWDLREKRELCTLALFEDNDDWVVSTPELRFDASENAIDKMYVVRGSEIIPLESLFEKLYTPKLLGALLAGEKLAPPGVDLNNLRPAPLVKLSLAEGTRNLTVEDDTAEPEFDRDAVRLRASAEASNSTVAEIRLFQNGKLVTTAAGSGPQHAQSFDVQLVPGENVFRAVALNAERTESRAAELIVTYRAPKPTAAAPGASAAAGGSGGGLQLHLLIVGVNAYQNPKYNLNYAVADATAVKQRIEAQTKSIFTAVNVRFIVNDQANKEAIVDAFKAMAEKAGARDVFVFYYAGHGVMTSDAKPEFFLVPHDVTQLYGADDALRQKGLASAELMELSKLMPAQKQLFILDACQSAGALKSVAMRGAAEEKAIAQLARSTGTHWLTASGSEQFATEFDQLGHGAFTYALLEGLSGKADGGETGDGRITVNELKAWLETQVPEITLKHKGTPQYPSSYGFGQDFPIVVIAN